MISEEQPIEKKKVLKKVRRDFLYKKPESNDPLAVDPSTFHLSGDQVFVLNQALGLVVKNRKIVIGIQFMTNFMNIDNISVEEQSKSRAVTLTLKPSESNTVLPWEYAAKRLESFGDLEFATWAHKLRNYEKFLPQRRKKYFEGWNEGSLQQINERLQQARLASMLARKDIESKYTYRKIQLLFTKQTTFLLSTSYDEKFLKEIGHTVESFISWTKENGIYGLNDGTEPRQLDAAKKILDSRISIGVDIVKEGAEFVTYLEDNKKNKKSFVVQYIQVLEPTSEGMLTHGYLVLKRPHESDDGNKRLCCKEGEQQVNTQKIMKLETVEDVEMNPVEKRKNEEKISVNDVD